MPQPIEIFFSYAHEDEELMNDVRRQLIVYDRQRLIVKWHDRLIPAGGVWAGEIDRRLRRARVILLFVSPHFIESKYCYQVEMAEALRRHEAGKAVVIPVILRPCPWQDSPVRHLQALPRDGRAVTLWPNRDEACLDVAEGMMKVVRGISSVDAPRVQARDKPEKVRFEPKSRISVPDRPSAVASSFDPRQRRLMVDAEQMQQLVERVPSIEIVKTEGTPPILYVLRYHMDGVVGVNEDGSPRIGKEHLVELRLHDDYPMSLPFTRVITPVFHPNVFAGGNVCMGWFGIPYNLPDICIHIARMIDYQIYNTTPFPVDMKAAEWAKEHSSRFPLTNWDVPGPTTSSAGGVGIKRVEQRTVEVEVLIISTGARYSVSAPVDMGAGGFKSSLIGELKLPSRFEGGGPVRYILQNRTQRKRLLDELTLQENGVANGDTLVFVIDEVAG